MVDVPRLGKRGEGWVVLQFAVVAAIVALGVTGPSWPSPVRRLLEGVGLLLVLGGAVVMARAARALGSGFTPLPRPSASGTLVETGPYAVVRHPVYSGGIALFAGVSLALSPSALVGTAALAVLWALKARVEERFLLARHSGYAAYCARTRYRLIPCVY